MMLRQTLPMRGNQEQNQQQEDEANPQVSVKAASIYFISLTWSIHLLLLGDA
jgi:hypothetical protein